MFYNIGFLFGFVSTFGMAVFVAWAQPAKPEARLWSLLSFLVSIWFLGRFTIMHCYTIEQAFFWQRFMYIGAIYLNVVYFQFVLAFLNDPKKRVFLGLGYFLTTGLQIVNLTSHLFISAMREGSVFHFYEKNGPFYWIHIVIYLVYPGYGAYLLFRARAEASPERRNQIDYVLVASIIGFVCGATTFPLIFRKSIPPIGGPFVPVYTCIIVYAIVKHQLLDIRVVIKRTLLYSIVSASLIAIYGATLTLITHLLEGHGMPSSAYPAAISAGVITLLFDPLRKRIQQFIDKRFFRTRVDREEKLMKFSNQIVEQQDLAQITRSLCHVLSESLNPKSFAVYSRSEHDASFNEIYKEGTLPFPPVLPPNAEFTTDLSTLGIKEMIPLISRGEALGFLLLGEKRSELPYSEEDRVLLRLLANQSALAYERPRLLHEVSSGLVHEIKMPMANIALPAELTYLQLCDAAEKGVVPMELLPTMQKRMKYIMDQAMLASHRVDALEQMNDSSGIAMEAINLPETIESGLAVIRELASKTGVRIETHIQDDLSEIHGNAEQLKIVFTNLFKNAIEAMADNGQRPRELVLKADRTKNEVILTLSDTGPGVPSSDHDLVFQSHYSTKGAHGSGMGLFLARQIIRAHGGSIVLRSFPSQGACFEIHFPAGNIQ